jgi:DEAD/DEAH box helicase domain-containing protein
LLLEDKIFEQTRTWLADDPWRREPKTYPLPSRIFHLVVDELHTYRGTAGTEVAYLIRLLLHRLGISPDSPQVRFLASSASLTNNENDAASRRYLKEFFGVSVEPQNPEAFARTFAVIGRPPLVGLPRRPRPLWGQSEAFTMFRSDWHNNPMQSVQSLAQRLGIAVPPTPTLHGTLRELLDQAEVPHAVLEAKPCAPETPAQLGARVFGTPSSREAVAGLLQALALARMGDDPRCSISITIARSSLFPQCPGAMGLC